MSENGIVRYTASDGSDVKLSPGIVTRYVVTGGEPVEDREVYSFMAKCQARKLNPLAGDAYMTTYRNRCTGRVEASVIVSKDYFLRTATQQETFDGFRAGVVVVDRDGCMERREGCIYGKQTERLVGGWAEVHDKSRSVPSRAEVSLAEYDQHRSLWLTKPATMIRKVALVQALREAYPGAYGGLYDATEMPDRMAEAVPVPATVEAVQEPQPQPQPAPEPQPEAVADPVAEAPEVTLEVEAAAPTAPVELYATDQEF